MKSDNKFVKMTGISLQIFLKKSSWRKYTNSIS